MSILKLELESDGKRFSQDKRAGKSFVLVIFTSNFRLFTRELLDLNGKSKLKQLWIQNDNKSSPGYFQNGALLNEAQWQDFGGKRSMQRSR